MRLHWSYEKGQQCETKQDQTAAGGIDERQVARTAADHDVRLYPIGTYWHRPKRERQGLVLGYAHLTEREISDGVTAGLP